MLLHKCAAMSPTRLPAGPVTRLDGATTAGEGDSWQPTKAPCATGRPVRLRANRGARDIRDRARTARPSLWGEPLPQVHGSAQRPSGALPYHRSTDPGVVRFRRGWPGFGSLEMSNVAQGPGWWIASDGKWYPPETHPQYRPPPPAPPSTTEDRSTTSRAWLLLLIGSILVVFGIARLLLDLSATALGTSVSCGNALGWLSNNHQTSSLVVVCTSPLHNASVEGLAAVAVGMALLFAWLFVVRAWWPLIVFAAFLIFLATSLAGYVLIGGSWAAGLLLVFGVWRGFNRRGA